MILKVEESTIMYNICYRRRGLNSYLKVYNLEAELKFWKVVLQESA